MQYLSICKYFIDMEEDANNMDLLRLMKLLYIAHGFILAQHKSNPYIDKDSFQAWEYGPVLPDLYRDYKHYNHDFNNNVADAPEVGEEYKSTLEVVWERYKDVDRFSLVGLTHQEGTPWHRCYRQHSKKIVIPDKITKAYYSLLIEKLRESNSINL